MSFFDLEPTNPIELEHKLLYQCYHCLKKWEPGTYKTKRGEDVKTCPHCGKRHVEATRTNPTTIVLRKDLAMLTGDRYPDMFCPSTTLEELVAERNPIATYGKAKIFISRGYHPADDGHYAYLFEGDTLWMTSWKGERLCMLLATMYECPGGRVFIGGLGIGLILLYLAVSRKTTEVIVAEQSADIIGLIEPIIRPWLARKYPNFKWTIVKGDAYEEVQKHGKFDWIYFDIWKDASLLREDLSVQRAYEVSEPYLTERGVISNWVDAVKAYDIQRHTWILYFPLYLYSPKYIQLTTERRLNACHRTGEK